jgi:antitoxin VapB
MTLKIDDNYTLKLAHELSELTGESMTSAITQALRERLDRVRSTRGDGLAHRLIRIGRECAAHLQEPARSLDHGELLYDREGLPRRSPSKPKS